MTFDLGTVLTEMNTCLYRSSTVVLNLGVVTPKGVILNFQGGRDEIGFTNLFIIICIHCYADNIIDVDMLTV